MYSVDINEYRKNLRDQFAMAALPGVIKGYDRFFEFAGSIAYNAYSIADAMMEEACKK